MSDRRVLQIIETELAKAVTFIDLEDERIMSEELSPTFTSPQSQNHPSRCYKRYFSLI